MVNKYNLDFINPLIDEIENGIRISYEKDIEPFDKCDLILGKIEDIKNILDS